VISIYNGTTYITSELAIPIGYATKRLDQYAVELTYKRPKFLFFSTTYKLVYHPFYVTPPISFRVYLLGRKTENVCYSSPNGIKVCRQVPVYTILGSFNATVDSLGPAKPRTSYYELVELGKNDSNYVLSDYAQFYNSTLHNVTLIYDPSTQRYYLFYRAPRLYPATYSLLDGLVNGLPSNSEKYFFDASNFQMISLDLYKKFISNSYTLRDNIGQEDLLKHVLRQILQLFYMQDVPEYEFRPEVSAFSTGRVNAQLDRLLMWINQHVFGGAGFHYREIYISKQQVPLLRYNVLFIPEFLVLVNASKPFFIVYKPYISFIDFRPYPKFAEESLLTWIMKLGVDPILSLFTRIQEGSGRISIVHYDEWTDYKLYDEYPAPYSAVFRVTLRIDDPRFLAEYQKCKTVYRDCKIFVVADVAS